MVESWKWYESLKITEDAKIMEESKGWHKKEEKFQNRSSFFDRKTLTNDIEHDKWSVVLSFVEWRIEQKYFEEWTISRICDVISAVLCTNPANSHLKCPLISWFNANLVSGISNMIVYADEIVIEYQLDLLEWNRIFK